MSQYREYSNVTSNQAGCTYSSLGSTYNGLFAGNEIASQANYTVPKLCMNGPGATYPPTYNTLSHGQDYLCGGYFSMKGAYPLATCDSCNVEYIQRPCAGNILNQCNPSPATKEGFCGSCGM